MMDSVSVPSEPSLEPGHRSTIFAQCRPFPCRWGFMASHDLESLTGVGPATARALAAAGFVDRESIAAATVEQLVAVRGFAAARALALIAEAQSSDESRESSDEAPEKAAVVAPVPEDAGTREPQRRRRKKLQARHADLKERAKKARKKSKTAGSKKKRKRWAAEAERLAKKAKKTKKRLAQLG